MRVIVDGTFSSRDLVLILNAYVGLAPKGARLTKLAVPAGLVQLRYLSQNPIQTYK